MKERQVSETEYTGIWRAKGIVDEAKTLDEMIEKLEEEAALLKRYRENGVKLTAPVEDDYAFLSTTNVAFAVEEGFDEEHYED